jgi:hypothetical protein
MYQRYTVNVTEMLENQTLIDSTKALSYTAMNQSVAVDTVNMC